LRGIGHDTEELKIEAGPDLITVMGRGLARIAAALDLSSLEVLSETGAANGTVQDSKIFVSTITLENARDNGKTT
jgi:ABC-type hemin transport system substrate-binding protein